MHVSVDIEVLDSADLNKPSPHTEHVGSSVVVPTADVYSPAGQLVCALHVSVAIEVLDSSALKKSSPQVRHVGCSVVVPTADVYSPAGQLV